MPVLELTDEQAIALILQLSEAQKERVLAQLAETKPTRKRPQFGSGKNDILYIADDFDAPQEVSMSFKTYENRHNKHATVHRIGCSQLYKHGGEHKYEQGNYKDHSTFAEADAYAKSTGFPVIYCSFCKPEIAS